MPSEFEKFIATSRTSSGRPWHQLRFGDVAAYVSRMGSWCSRKRWRRAASVAGSRPDRNGRLEQLEAALGEASRTIGALTAQVKELERSVTALGRSRRADLHLPFTERAQALRMVREGRSARQISSALGLPQGEILLLTRIQELHEGAAPAGMMRQIAEAVGESA